MQIVDCEAGVKLLIKSIIMTLRIILDHTKSFFQLINNYSPMAKWILVNIPRHEVEGNIHQYSRAWGE